MDEFPGLLERDFGFRPQGKSAPMASSRAAESGRSSASTFTPSYSSFPGKSDRESSRFGDASPIDQVSGTYASRSFRDYRGGMGDLDDIFSGGSKRPSWHSSSSPPYNLDSVLDGLKDTSSQKNSSAPVYDKAVYDDDMFDGVPGLKSSSNANFDNMFAQMSSSSNRTSPPYEDLLGTLSGKESKSSVLGDKANVTTPPYDDLLGISTKDHQPSELGDRPSSFDDILGSFGGKEHKSSSLREKSFEETAPRSMPGFDDLIPGFGGSSPSSTRNHSQATNNWTSSTAMHSETITSHDPFVDLGPTTVPANPSSSIFVSPLEDINVRSGVKKNATYYSGAFNDIHDYSNSSRQVPHLSSNMKDTQKNNSSLKPPHGTSHEHLASVKENSGRSTAWNSADTSSKKVAVGGHREPQERQFDLRINPSQPAPVGVVGSQTADVNFYRHKTNEEEPSQAANDIWVTVSEIPLFTQPTSAPPPSRSPPPFIPKRSTYNDKSASSNANAKKKVTINDSSDCYNDSSKIFGVSSVDELEAFAKVKTSMTDEQSEVLYSEEDIEKNSAAATSAAAMKEAMDRAEAKFRYARDLREREKESKSVKTRDSVHLGPDISNKENSENLESLERERDQMERDLKEKEQKRLERERERELAREKAAVERALREARERAAAEARQKAERAAVEKANAEARERAARAAVQRATTEARERAEAEARERAAAESRERAAAEARAAEARERAATEAKEKAAREREAKEKSAAMTRDRERAAVQRAAADARARAERAAVERAHAEARERAAAAAREKLHKNENDLDTFFGMGTRANSEPKQRASTMDTPLDTQVRNKGAAPDGARGAPSSSSIRKASSSTNFLDDLNSVFGAPASSGEFQEMDGESEERRRARLERHQRTLERAAKALAEKNERDNQIQRDQAERHRIAETLDIEIKRWAAGKEGNLRALLSTMQYVLWPECGWQAVSLTDLITSISVKKVYRKATLCIHPDKVQQKGATLQQKYIAEKVFDLLKEAWNKFNSEELF